VIVPDATRKAGLRSVLPAILDRLRLGGINEDAMTVLIANGTHPAVGREAITELVGPLPPDISIIEHDSRSSDLVEVGELRPGVPLRLHPRAVDCDFLITVGTVRHHYFAGFGGGPKMVFPGVGGYEEIQANHSLVLDLSGDQPIRHPCCEPGLLEGNPIADEIVRAAGLRPPDLALCLVEGRDGGVGWASAGPWEAAFAAAVAQVRSWFEIPSQERFDLMVAGAAGAPTDSTLIQAHKALDAACRFLEPGGELLWLASLDKGTGSDDMEPFMVDPQPVSILDRLGQGWVQYGHTALRIVEKTARFRVTLHAAFDTETLNRLGFEPTDDPEAVVERWRERSAGARVGVMATGVVFPSR
jgi:nickel-dependent lactate racemase